MPVINQSQKLSKWRLINHVKYKCTAIDNYAETEKRRHLHGSKEMRKIEGNSRKCCTS